MRLHKCAGVSCWASRMVLAMGLLLVTLAPTLRADEVDAEVMFHDGKQEEAIKYLKEQIKAHPEKIVHRRKLAKLYFFQEKDEEVQKILTKLYQEKKDAKDLPFLLGSYARTNKEAEIVKLQDGVKAYFALLKKENDLDVVAYRVLMLSQLKAAGKLRKEDIFKLTVKHVDSKWLTEDVKLQGMIAFVAYRLYKETASEE